MNISVIYSLNKGSKDIGFKGKLNRKTTQLCVLSTYVLLWQLPLSPQQTNNHYSLITHYSFVILW